MQMYTMGREDENLDKALKKAVGRNPITDAIVDDEVLEERCAIFCAVHDLVRSAHDLYTEGELSWDKTMQGLSDALAKLVGKEKALMDANEKDESEAEGEDEDDDEED